MGEEAADDYDLELLGGGGNDDDDRVMEWETGLPGSDEVTPLSQPLVPPGLAAAFRIPPEPGRTLLDVHRASAATVSRLRLASSSSSASSFPTFQQAAAAAAAAGGVLGGGAGLGGLGGGGGGGGGGGRADEADSSAREEESASAVAKNESNNTMNSSKRPRLVWTPQLHKRFVDVVAHLGIKNAVPKTIMQLMNVEGLTRENVASHLQKYRLYVKRMQGLSNEGPSPSDHIFASTPVPHALVHEVPAAVYHHHQSIVGMVPVNSPYQHQHQHSGAGYGGHGVSSSYQYHQHATK